MKKIYVKGPIISNGDKWIYEWFGGDATCPNDIINALPDDGSEVNVVINSGGGYVNYGNEIYTELKSYKGKVDIVVIEACSAASVIAMAGDTVKMTPVGKMMIHNSSGAARGDYHVMDKASEVMQKVNQSIANAYQIKTGIDKEKLLDLMDKETWMTAEEAKEMGFVDEILFQDEKIELFTACSRDLLPEPVIQKMQSLKLTGDLTNMGNHTLPSNGELQDMVEKAVERALLAQKNINQEESENTYSRFFF